MKIGKIVETSIYSTNLEDMKDFYVNKLGLEFVSEQKDRHVFIQITTCFSFLITRLQ